MSGIIDDVVTYLKAQSTVTALVGSGTSARILNQDGMKQSGTLPALTVLQTDEQVIKHAGGNSRLCNATIEIVAYASTPSARNTLAGVVRDVLTPNVGPFGSTAVTEVVRLNAGADGDDAGADGSDTRIYWKALAYRVWYYTAS